MKNVLILCSDESVIEIISQTLGCDMAVRSESSFNSGINSLSETRYDILFCDYELAKSKTSQEESSITDKLRNLHELYPEMQIVVLALPETLSKPVEFLEDEVSSFLAYPLDKTRIRLLVEDFETRQSEKHELDYLRERFWRKDPLGLSKSNSPKMLKVLDQAKSVAPTKTTVLLTGESGTGKGTLARLIQGHSTRADKPFIEVHCGAIPDTLLESELFGHEKGSFTGAHRRKLGKFEIAQGGTLFLDEISTITSALQIKLLQVLQDKIFYRVGSETPLQTDIRIISASNTNLEKMVEDGLFREDLYYRLNVFPLRLPPLRERKEDIPQLISSILQRLNFTHLKAIEGLDPVVLHAFEAYPWPGNIRELENILERAYILERSSVLRPESFPGEIIAFHPAVMDEDPPNQVLSLKEARQRGVSALEKEYLSNLLSKYKGHVRESAKIAGVTPRQLHKLIKKYGIRSHAFRHPD